MEDENIKLAANAAEMQRGRPFKPGESGNPEGKKPGTKNYLKQLEEALEEEAKKTGVSYWQKLAQWCYRNPMTATAILKKFIPDKTSTEIKGDGLPITINLVPVKTKEDIENLDDD